MLPPLVLPRCAPCVLPGGWFIGLLFCFLILVVSRDCALACGPVSSLQLCAHLCVFLWDGLLESRVAELQGTLLSSEEARRIVVRCQVPK